MLLVWLAAALVAGDLCGAAIPLGGVALAGGSAAAGLPFRRLRLPALLVLAFSVGMWRTPHSSSAITPLLGRTVAIQGVIAQEPDVRDGSVRYLIRVRSMQRQGGWRPLRGTVLVIAPRGASFDQGDVLTLQGLMRPAGGRADAELWFPKLSLTGHEASLAGIILAWRRWLQANINSWLPEPEAALLIAIALGVRSVELGSLAPVLVHTGLIHIIAISGIKVGLVAGTIYELVRRLRFPWLAWLLSTALLLLYVMLTGATISGFRAALMWALIFLATPLGRRTVTLVSLACAVLVMVLIDPALPWDVPFQLSVLGTAGVVAFGDVLMRRTSFLPSPFREALAVTLAAQLATAPVVAATFHVSSFDGPLANLVVLPALPFLILLGLVLGLCAAIAPLAALIAAVAYSLLHATVLAAQWFDAHGPVRQGGFSVELTAAYFFVLAAIAWAVLRRSAWNPPGRTPHPLHDLGLAALAGLVLATPLAFRSKAQGVTWLGDGVLVQCGSAAVLVDGSPHPFAFLEAVSAALPLQTHTLDAVFVTDPRASKLAGLEAVLAHYQVGVVLDTGVEYPSRSYARWRDEVRRQAKVYALRSGAVLRSGCLQMRALAPAALRPRPTDSVGVIQASVAGKTYLLAGAASLEEQRELIFSGLPLHADVLVLDGPAEPDFVQAVGAHRVYTKSPGPAQTLLEPGLPLR